MDEDYDGDYDDGRDNPYLEYEPDTELDELPERKPDPAWEDGW